MKRTPYLPMLLISVFSAGCATIELKSKSLNFEAVRALPLGKITDFELREKFGNPDKTISLTAEYEAWFYLDHASGSLYDRASFVLDKAQGTVLTATWVPGDGEQVSNKAGAIEYFKNASFRTKDVGWVAGHEYSNDVYYSDPNIGVTIRVNRTTQSVVAIAFDQEKFITPTTNGKPTSQSDK